MPNTTDEQAINEIVEIFFDLFTNTNNRKPNLQKIKEIFIPAGIIVNNTADEPDIYDIENFIKPREKILTDGTLINFSEKEISYQMEICGNIAHRKSIYVKSGIWNGEPYSGSGIKLMQFIKIKNTWLFASVIWYDKK